MPVMLPPGLFKFETKPFSTGSDDIVKTIGIVRVNSLQS